MTSVEKVGIEAPRKRQKLLRSAHRIKVAASSYKYFYRMEWIILRETGFRKNSKLSAKTRLRLARLLLGMLHVVLLEFAVQRGLPNAQHARR